MLLFIVHDDLYQSSDLRSQLYGYPFCIACLQCFLIWLILIDWLIDSRYVARIAYLSRLRCYFILHFMSLLHYTAVLPVISVIDWLIDWLSSLPACSCPPHHLSSLPAAIFPIICTCSPVCASEKRWTAGSLFSYPPPNLSFILLRRGSLGKKVHCYASSVGYSGIRLLWWMPYVM